MSDLIGIDEAGLGPVFGPLVVAGIRVTKHKLPALRKKGARDSKRFGNGITAREKRNTVLKKIAHHFTGHSFRIIPADAIDTAFSCGQTMYELELNAIKNILVELEFHSAEIIYIHRLGNVPLEKFLKGLDFHGIELEIIRSKIIYEMDADSKYIPVSAASILAKTTRDREIERICGELGIGYVNGYANGATERFLKDYHAKNGSLPPETRKTRNWKPLRDLLDAASS